MQVFGTVSTTLKIARRLSCCFSSGRYTSLVKTKPQQVGLIEEKPNGLKIKNDSQNDVNFNLDVPYKFSNASKNSELIELNIYGKSSTPLSEVKKFNAIPNKVKSVSGHDHALANGFVAFLNTISYNSTTIISNIKRLNLQHNNQNNDANQSHNFNDVGELFSRKINNFTTLFPPKYNVLVPYERKNNHHLLSSLQVPSPVLFSRKYLSSQTSSNKRNSNPYIVCIADNNKGCISPGNAHLPIYKPETVSEQLKDINKRNERKKLKNCTPACNGHKEVSTAQRIVPCNLTSDEKIAKDKCKDDVCNEQPSCPDPCKDELEKLEKLNTRKKWKKNEIPPDCISSKCKKKEYCDRTKPKKAGGAAEIKEYKFDKDSGKDSCKKKEDSSKKREENPCHKQKKDNGPKCNRDPCQDKKKKEESGNRSGDEKDKMSKDKNKGPCKKKDDDSKKKDDTSKNKNDCKKPDDPCKKKEDTCKKKDDQSKNGNSGIDKKDGCQKKEGDNKKKDNSADKKNDSCKKNEDASKMKDNACKQKDESSKKKDDSCNRKGEPSNKKDDPCKKNQDSSKNKDDPCKKKDDPCKKKR